ncbi:MFS transporter [Paractinoplanes hotanensis]|uniref:MFS transporter n=1 Tax=Paractinoplanes hotanensis TaxID=2906497 RepID=A0ABT0XRY8_9ACTN|nr:MFS transporter [Actinoplanes hotanensis]MCM4076370.1 MFS transporter [Actinoplanes hotanensis]
MTRRLTLLFAVAAGAAVANLYWSQPLLDLIADDLDAGPAAAGWLITATQLGYAAGILFLVPLGDVVERRRLVRTVLLCSAGAALLCAVAPSLGLLMGALVLLGVTTVSGQILAPLAGDLADDAERGHVVGTVISGILVGILISRTVAGFVAGVAGWRAIYVVAALIAVGSAVVLSRRIPVLPAREHIPYWSLIASVGQVLRRERTARWTVVLAATAFGAFTMFWTALTFLLSGPPYHYSVQAIGLFGIAGLAGALAAQRAGRLHDRGLSLPATGVAWALLLVAFGLALAGRNSVVTIVIAVVLLDAAAQTIGILNQTRLFTLSPGARSRLNTVYVTSNFLGGAAGSAAATLLWSAGGWAAVCVAGLAASGFALTVWAVGRRGALVPG